ncbi:tetratricopeptide repeat protein 28-like [Oculina patagonica]
MIRIMKPTRALYVALNVADFLCNTHRYTKAIKFYEECFVLLRLTIAHQLERTIPNEPHDIERQLYIGLSEAYSESGFTEKAIDMCKGCLKINKETGNKRRESECYEDIGRMYFNLGQCEKSISYHEKALAIRKAMKNKVLEAQSYSNLCLVYKVLNQYEKAIGYAEKSLEIGNETGDRETEGIACTNLSQIYFDLGQYEKAIKYQEKDLKISKEYGDQEGEGTCYNNLGCIYCHLSRYDKSIEYFEKGLKIVQEIGFRQGEGRSYLNLATAYRDLGEYAKSLQYCEKALIIIRSLKYREEEGAAYLFQAGIYLTLGEHEKSMECCKQALAIKTMMGDKRGQASCYSTFGGIYKKLGQHEEAISHVKQSLKISEEIGDLKGQGVSCYNLACTYCSLGYYEKSIEYFEKDLQISKAIGDRYGEGRNLCSIGTSYFALGQLEKSLEYQKKALKIMKEIGSTPGESYVNQYLGATHSAYWNLSEAVHRFTDSINSHEKMRSRLKDEHKLSLDDDNISSYRMLCLLLVALDKPDDALCAVEQGRARGLVDLLSMRYGIQEVSDARTLNLSTMRELFTRQRTNFLILGTPLGTIMLWFVSKDGKISFISLNYRDSNGKDLEQHLKELIESISHSLQGIQCEDRSLDAWYETSQPVEACRSKETAQSEHSKDKETAKERRFQLVFEMVISPIVDLIDSPEIVIVPEATLFLIPFSALQDSSGGYLSETVRIRLIPSLTTLKLIQDSPADYHCQSGALIVGDPKVGRVNFKGNVVELCALPKAREEAQMVSALLGVPCLVGEQASKEEVLRRIQEVSLVHIAAHGDVERGEIALAPNSSVIGIPKKDDFMLTMKDIAEVGIRAKLVVLSCCHSASGKILKAEGVVGIARAFLGSGARSVLMSLWAVDDEATKTFMDIFYKCLIHEKMSASEALHQSIKKMRESPNYKAVKYWAPFVLLGDDITLDLK